MTWVLLILAAALFAPYLIDARRPRMNDARRASAPGEFVTLSRGVTHYQWHGDAAGPVAVCVHGLTTPSFVWTPIVGDLVARGFRVLTYDLYGRGYSDRPRGDQDAEFFVTQLEELLESQKVVQPITLLGYSMGGPITTAFTARFHDRVQQLVLLAPAGMGHDLGPIARLVVNHRWLGGWLMMAWYGRSYGQALEAERDEHTDIPGVVDLQLAELDTRGFRGAVLSSMRGILDRDFEAEHRLLAEVGLPVLAIWGREDEIIPIKGKSTLSDWNPGAVHGVIENAGHSLAYSHSAQVSELLQDLMLVDEPSDQTEGS